MQTFDLFMSLLTAENENDVDGILEKAGYGLHNEAVWASYGGVENNFSTVGNQQTEPTGAFVEKIINGIDAVLMAECFKADIDPENGKAPKSMVEAVEQFFEVHEGRLENLLPKQQTELAERIGVVAVGDKASPSYLIIDNGEGQTPNRFPDTLLSLNKSNKMRIPFVQGKFNSGGTGVLQFCGRLNMQLVVSRRNPTCPVRDGDTSGNEWGFTLVRRRRRTMAAEARPTSTWRPVGRCRASRRMRACRFYRKNEIRSGRSPIVRSCSMGPASSSTTSAGRPAASQPPRPAMSLRNSFTPPACRFASRRRGTTARTTTAPPSQACGLQLSATPSIPTRIKPNPASGLWHAEPSRHWQPAVPRGCFQGGFGVEADSPRRVLHDQWAGPRRVAQRLRQPAVEVRLFEGPLARLR